MLTLGCSRETVTDIDSFILKFNSLSQQKIEKTDISGFSENGEICHCFMFGETLISLNSKEDTMKIFSADAVTEKVPDDEYKNAVMLMLKSITDIPYSDISDTVNELVTESGGFVRTLSQTHDYTFSFISADAGSKFTVKFNELVPTRTTEIPVTNREYDNYSTIPEPTG